MKRSLQTKQLKKEEVILSSQQTAEELEVVPTEELLAYNSSIPSVLSALKADYEALLESSGLNDLEAKSKAVKEFESRINSILASRLTPEDEILTNCVSEDETQMAEVTDPVTGEVTTQPIVVDETKTIISVVYTYKVKDNIDVFNFINTLFDNGLKCCVKFLTTSLDTLTVEEAKEMLTILNDYNPLFLKAFKISETTLNNTLGLYPDVITLLVDANYIDVISETKRVKAKQMTLADFIDIPVESVDITPTTASPNVLDVNDEDLLF